jgi:hypothetical protein
MTLTAPAQVASPSSLLDDRRKEVPMSKAQGGEKEQAGEREALRARLDYALELANWANQVPQPPPTTMAKTMNDVLAETCAKLAKIATCYHLQGVLDSATDGQVLSDDPTADAYFENIKEGATEGMKAAGCSSIL